MGKQKRPSLPAVHPEKQQHLCLQYTLKNSSTAGRAQLVQIISTMAAVAPPAGKWLGLQGGRVCTQAFFIEATPPGTAVAYRQWA